MIEGLRAGFDVFTEANLHGPVKFLDADAIINGVRREIPLDCQEGLKQLSTYLRDPATLSYLRRKLELQFPFLMMRRDDFLLSTDGKSFYLGLSGINRKPGNGLARFLLNMTPTLQKLVDLRNLEDSPDSTTATDESAALAHTPQTNSEWLMVGQSIERRLLDTTAQLARMPDWGLASLLTKSLDLVSTVDASLAVLNDAEDIIQRRSKLLEGFLTDVNASRNELYRVLLALGPSYQEIGSVNNSDLEHATHLQDVFEITASMESLLLARQDLTQVQLKRLRAFRLSLYKFGLELASKPSYVDSTERLKEFFKALRD